MGLELQTCHQTSAKTNKQMHIYIKAYNQIRYRPNPDILECTE